MYKYLSVDSLNNLNAVEPGLAIDMLNIFTQEYKGQKSRIDQAVDEKNHIEFAKNIHALKGSISVFGCDEICKNLKTIELQARNDEIIMALKLYHLIQQPLVDFLSEVERYNQVHSSEKAAV